MIRFEISGLPAAAIEPVPESSVSTVEERTLEERERWWKMGLKAISDGKLAVLLLSGGQVLLFFFVNVFLALIHTLICYFFFFGCKLLLLYVQLYTKIKKNFINLMIIFE